MAGVPQLGGTGKDADKGKERTQFERDRAKSNQGKNRPPIYKPQDDGQRGGYVGRSRIKAKSSDSNARKLAIVRFTVDNGVHQY